MVGCYIWYTRVLLDVNFVPIKGYVEWFSKKYANSELIVV